MEVLVTQRYQFAKIELHKNYCKLSDGPQRIIGDIDDFNNEPDNEPVFDNTQHRTLLDIFTVEIDVDVEGYMRLPEKKHKRSTYFHTEEGENINLKRCSWGGKAVFYTSKDRQIKKHFGNPFATIDIETIERKVTKNGDNLTFKIYRHVKHRSANWKFFKSSSHTVSVTFNLRTGDITTIVSDHGKKGMTRFRKNSFINLHQTIYGSGIFSIFTPYGTVPEYSKLRKEIMSAFPFDEYTRVLYDFFDIGYDVQTFQKRLFDAIVKKFVEIKKIKISNNYEPLLLNWYPTKKYLTKNGNKLIAAILDRFGFKSKYTIKLLHQMPNINFVFFLRICRIFGKDWSKYVPSINKNFFETVNKETNSVFIDPIKRNSLFNNSLASAATTLFVFPNRDKDRSKLVKLFNDMEKKGSSVNQEYLINELYDHFKMLHRVQEYYPDFEFKGHTSELFEQEHVELSKIDRLIKRGTSINYVFHQDMLDKMEEPIIVHIEDKEPIKFYPVVLKREEEYIEEGSHMHHCVATYANNDASLIVSLRENNPFGSNRVTSEFNVTHGNCIQSRYFCNAVPPEIFDNALNVLKDRVEFWKKKNKLKAKEKIVVPLIINGLEIKKEEPWKLFDTLLAETQDAITFDGF
jgi:hypothetical protein